MKLDILKLKANHYEWSCHVPEDVRKELEEMLSKINSALECK
jgi:hypothetical protein